MIHIDSTVQPRSGGEAMVVVAIEPDGWVACKALHSPKDPPRRYNETDLIHLDVRQMWINFEPPVAWRNYLMSMRNR